MNLYDSFKTLSEQELVNYLQILFGQEMIEA